MPLETEIPTPNGWTTMGELKDGDTVFGGNGKPCTVVSAYPVRDNRSVYELTFDDGDKVQADADHQWYAWSQYDLDEKKAPRVVTTQHMVDNLTVRNGQQKKWKIPLCQPVRYPEKNLPVHPYVLGAWLGDGTHRTAQFTCHADDWEIIDRCIELDNGLHGDINKTGETWDVTIGGNKDSVRGDSTLRSRLRKLGVLWPGQKRIPEEYLTASVDQRRELLKGLLDTDGSCCGTGGQSRIEFCNTNRELSADILQLVRSLGFKAKLIHGRSKLRGVDHGPKYRVTFTAREPVFHLKRKLERQKLDGDRTRTRHRTVVSIVPVQSVPVRCIAVNSENNTFLATRSYTVTHNTIQVGLSRTIWEVGRDPYIRILLVGESKPAARKLLRAIINNIEHNPRVKEVFPHLRRSRFKKDPWNTEDIVVDKPTPTREPTIQARGIGSKNILGSRLDLIVLDDILNLENSSSPTQRDKYEEWFDTTCFTRVQDEYDAKGEIVHAGRVYVIGTPWHREDLLHRLKRRSGWASKLYSAVLNKDDPPHEWQPLWPRVWPLKRLLDRMNGMTVTSFYRKWLCTVITDALRRFQKEWLDNMFAKGKGRTFLDGVPFAPGGGYLPTYTGVDLGIGKGINDALTVFFTIAIEAFTCRRIVIDVESGRWTGPEILSKALEKHRRFHSTMFVESNQAQKHTAQFIGEKVPCIGLFTGQSNKFDDEFGVESLAVEMRKGEWVAPSGDDVEDIHPELKMWREDMEHYDPEEHTGDHLMASWICREGMRKFGGNLSEHSNHMYR
jgi:hypothetical protein